MKRAVVPIVMLALAALAAGGPAHAQVAPDPPRPAPDATSEPELGVAFTAFSAQADHGYREAFGRHYALSLIGIVWLSGRRVGLGARVQIEPPATSATFDLGLGSTAFVDLDAIDVLFDVELRFPLVSWFELRAHAAAGVVLARAHLELRNPTEIPEDRTNVGGGAMGELGGSLLFNGAGVSVGLEGSARVAVVRGVDDYRFGEAFPDSYEGFDLGLSVILLYNY